MGGPWLPSATAFFNVFLMASLKVSKRAQQLFPARTTCAKPRHLAMRILSMRTF